MGHPEPASRHDRPASSGAPSWVLPSTACRSLPSVVVVAHRDVERLPACLESVAAIADERVVVVQDSRDPTSALALRLGARVFNRTCRAATDRLAAAPRRHGLDRFGIGGPARPSPENSSEECD